MFFNELWEQEIETKKSKIVQSGISCAVGNKYKDFDFDNYYKKNLILFVGYNKRDEINHLPPAILDSVPLN